MKLIRFGSIGNEKPGIHIDGKNYDLSKHIKDYDETFFANGGLASLASLVKANSFPQMKELDLLLQDLLKFYVLV
jgi:2,4-diketo-3-deoxy-L-fuconate hydrolase